MNQRYTERANTHTYASRKKESKEEPMKAKARATVKGKTVVRTQSAIQHVQRYNFNGLYFFILQPAQNKEQNKTHGHKTHARSCSHTRSRARILDIQQQQPKRPIHVSILQLLISIVVIVVPSLFPPLLRLRPLCYATYDFGVVHLVMRPNWKDNKK